MYKYVIRPTLQQNDIPEYWNLMGKYEEEFLAKCYLILLFYLNFTTEVFNQAGNEVPLSSFLSVQY